MSAWLWGIVGLCCGLLFGGLCYKLWQQKCRTSVLPLDEDLRLVSRKLAHEIRNPLNAMNLHVQLLEEELLGSETAPANTQRRLQRLQHEIERLDRILTDYQRYARLPTPEFAECDLSALLGDLLDFIEPETEHRGIQLERQITPLPDILCDPPQIRQVLLNLILNANQAMPEGGTLTVRTAKVGDHVQIDIEDTGIGIPADIQANLFEPFLSTKEEGTGLGLPMAKHVIEAHGGTLAFRSQPGQGTTFTVQLPCQP